MRHQEGNCSVCFLKTDLLQRHSKIVCFYVIVITPGRLVLSI